MEVLYGIYILGMLRIIIILFLIFPIAYAEYILMEPSKEYSDIMSSVHEKIYLSKVG